MNPMDQTELAATPRCSAHSRSGAQCRRAPMHGSKVCRMHGGAAPQVMAKASERVEQQKALTEIGKLIARVEGEVIADPQQLILDLITQSAAQVRVLAMLVEEDGSIEQWGLETKKSSVHYSMWNDERDRLHKYCDTAIRAGFTERMVKMAEAHGSRIIEAILRAVKDPEWQLDPQQQEIGPRIVGRHLRSMAT